MNKIIAYTRVSTKEQGKSGLGLEAQLTAIQNFCKLNGLDIVAHYSEVQSGADDDRPQLAEAFKHAKKAKAVVLVSKLDRLSRDVHFIAGLMKYEQPFATAEDGLNCPTLQLQLKAVVAQNERDMISQRTKAALAAKKERGEKVGGYREGAAEAAAAALKAQAEAFAKKMEPMLMRARAQRMTVEQIAAEWNAMGLPTRTGKQGAWCGSTISRMLKRLQGDEYKRFGRCQKQQEGVAA